MDSSQFSQTWNWGTTDGGGELPVLSNTAAATPAINSSNDKTIGPDSAVSGDASNDGDHEDDDYEEDEEWDKDTAEIQSISSEELHETRPNRWTGNPFTWKRWTKNDRDAWTSLKGVRMDDLSVHLYNAFALKRDAVQDREVGKSEKIQGEVLPRSGQKDMEEGGEEGSGWVPPRMWTAWPVKDHKIHVDGDLLAKTKDIDEGDTFRRRDWTDALPSRNLEEEVSAGILRAAKERFRRRKLGEKRKDIIVIEDDDEDEVMDTVEGTTSEWRATTRSKSRSRNRSMSRGAGNISDQHYTSGEESTSARRSRKRKISRTYTPTVLADDGAAYDMIRPATRRILRKLDDTLTILHNSRIATLHVGEPEESDESDDGGDEEEETDGEAEQSPSSTKRKKRGRPRNPSLVPHYEKERSHPNRGRPRKVHVPRDGETEEEMLIRLRKEQKRRMPDSYFESDRSGTEMSRSQRRSKARKNRKRPVSRGSRASSVASGASSVEYDRKDLKRIPLRDWRDVIGAAALAGFEPEAIARATQRCATLFGQGMTINTLHEAPAKKSLKEGMETATFTPGNLTQDDDVLLSEEEHSRDSEELLMLRNRRATSRQPSMRLTAEPPSSPGMTTGSENDGKRRRRRSATPGRGGGPHLCPHADCPLALTGFSRAWNLKRHLENLHGERKRSRSDMATDDEDGEEEDSMDEMFGGVHVDGFLQPIKVRKGWRTETGERPKRYKPRERGRSRRKGSVGRGWDEDEGGDEGVGYESSG